MSAVEQINVNHIDPDSTINVRRGGIDENVDKVKTSIKEHGYWSEMAIVVRPHPNPSSEYKYEHITGQCRFKACIALGLEKIPAFVIDMDDDDAIQRSWLENEARGDLTTSDKTYWTEKIYKKFSSKGHTSGEAFEKAAEYLGVTKHTAMGYYTLAVLPDSLQDMVDKKTLTQSNAETIVKNTYDTDNLEQSQQQMIERADWLLSLERNDRITAIDAMKKQKHGASIEELEEDVNKESSTRDRTISYAIPSEQYDDLIKWGKTRGLEEPHTIVSYIVTDKLRHGNK